MQNFVTDKIILADKDKFADRFIQPDLTAFHRLDNLIQSDNKENNICLPFAFLKISKKDTALLSAPTKGLTPTQAKELQ